MPNSIATSLIPELTQETATGRRVLERVPNDKGTWKPHPKSFPVGHLAQLVSWMPGWIANALEETSLDLATAPKYTFEKTETLLAGYDANVKAALAALEKAKDADFTALWSLKNGERLLFSAPRAMIVRQHISHFVHHRAQLGVYLRLLDVPVPSMYGPTADERTF